MSLEAFKKVFSRFSDNVLAVSPRFQKKIEEGKGFVVSRRFEGVASDAYVDIYFENPSGSGKKIHIEVVEVVSMAQAWVDIYRGNTVTASGTSIVPVNLNMESNNSSIANAEYGGSYSTGELISNTVCPGGSRIRAVGGAAEVGEMMIIPPGLNILVRVTNKSASATDLSVRILWWEE